MDIALLNKSWTAISNWPFTSICAHQMVSIHTTLLFFHTKTHQKFNLFQGLGFKCFIVMLKSYFCFYMNKNQQQTSNVKMKNSHKSWWLQIVLFESNPESIYITSLFFQNLVSPQNMILQEEEKTSLFFYFNVFFANNCILRLKTR